MWLEIRTTQKWQRHDPSMPSILIHTCIFVNYNSWSHWLSYVLFIEYLIFLYISNNYYKIWQLTCVSYYRYIIGIKY